jgi:hypothetical protein
MIFRYKTNSGALGKQGLLVAMGMVALPLSFHLHSLAASAPTKSNTPTPARDPRVSRLHRFLTKLECPVAGMAQDFVRAADENHLDWRLLPSIAVIESGGGKAYKNNNIFGWNGGEQSFVTIRSGLELVAYKLGHSALYRRQNSLGKLRIYNENEDYPGAVMAVMNRISPEVRLRTVNNVTPQSAMRSNDFMVVRY